MKSQELAPSKRSLIEPENNENVLPNPLTVFTQRYSALLNKLVTKSLKSAFDDDVTEDHLHVLNCIDYLTWSGGDLSSHQRAQVWWCANDLTSHLTVFQPELVSADTELLPLLQAIQRLVEPSHPELSEKDQREQLYFQWHRAQVELRSRISLPEDRGQIRLAALSFTISDALTTIEPSLEQLSQANRATRKLLSHITDTQDSVLIEIRELLQKIEKTIRLQERKGAHSEVPEEFDVYQLFTEYQTLYTEKLAEWFLQEINNPGNSDEQHHAAVAASVSATTIDLLIQNLKERQRNSLVSYSNGNELLDAIEGVFDYFDEWGGPDFLDKLSTNLAKMKEGIE